MLEKKTSYFITDDIEIYSDDSDEKTKTKKIEYINSFFRETRIRWIYFFKENKKNIRNFFKLGTLKLLPEI